MNKEIDDFIASETFKNLTKNIQIDGIFLGGSRYFGVNSENSDYDLIIVNSTFKKNWWFYLEEQGKKIDLFFVPDLRAELDNKVFELVKLYILLRPDNSDILKKFESEKPYTKKRIINLIKKYFLDYLSNFETKPYRKLDYHLCMTNMLMHDREIDIENIKKLKNTRKKNEWSKKQILELKKLIEGD